MRPKNQDGFGMTESIIAAGMLITLAVVGFSLTSKRKFLSNMGTKSQCENMTSDVGIAIKKLDNQTIVRNWMPKILQGAAGTNGGDPFCVGGPRSICEQFQPLVLRAGGYVDEGDFRTHVNVRGAHTWAQNFYNLNRPNICSTNADGTPKGITYTPAALGSLLPIVTPLPENVTDYQLYIKDSALNCNLQSTSRNAQFNIVVKANYNRTDGQANECVSKINIVNPPLEAPPPLQITVTNGGGAPVRHDPAGVGYCTDARPLPVGGSDSAWQNIDINFQPIRKGSILLCRKNAYQADAAGMFRACGDQTVDGLFDMAPNETTITYNADLTPTLQFRNMNDTTNATLHEYQVKAVDVSGNVTPVFSQNFLVHRPNCPPADTYCSNASPAEPIDLTRCPTCTDVPTTPKPACADCWNNLGDINIRPYDDCMNGLCPVGTRVGVCDPAIAPYVCRGSFYGDDCNLATCPGSLNPSCPPAGSPAYTDAICGTVIPGTCTPNCGMGTGLDILECSTIDPRTVDCDCEIYDTCNTRFPPAPNHLCPQLGVGGLSGAIACTTPDPNIGRHDPGCDCDHLTAADYAGMPCNSAVDDRCDTTNFPLSVVTPNSCGPGQSGCSPCTVTPTPPLPVCTEGPISGVVGSATGCSDHKRIRGDTWCWDASPSAPRTVTASATCKTYTLTVNITGHRHGGSGMEIAVVLYRPSDNYGVGVWANRNDEFIHWYSSPGGSETNFVMSGIPTPQVQVFRASPGDRIETFAWVHIHDAGVVVQWTITPSTP